MKFSELYLLSALAFFLFACQAEQTNSVEDPLPTVPTITEAVLNPTKENIDSTSKEAESIKPTILQEEELSTKNIEKPKVKPIENQISIELQSNSIQEASSLAETEIKTISVGKEKKPQMDINNNDLFGSNQMDQSMYGGYQGNPVGDSGLGIEQGEKLGQSKRLKDRRLLRACQPEVNNLEEGLAWVAICVDAAGKVTNAKFILRNKEGKGSTISSAKLKQAAVDCAKEQRYTRAKEETCGEISIRFRLQ